MSRHWTFKPLHLVRPDAPDHHVSFTEYATESREEPTTTALSRRWVGGSVSLLLLSEHSHVDSGYARRRRTCIRVAIDWEC